MASVGIEEKPAVPRSRLAQTGIYFHDERVWSVLELIPPARGELEITDLNNISCARGRCAARRSRGYWIDAGTSHGELPAANVTVAELSRKGAI
jgi:glucose-1-phosphate thymidylyltransferase